jgi:hypothetical protein
MYLLEKTGSSKTNYLGVTGMGKGKGKKRK